MGNSLKSESVGHLFQEHASLYGSIFQSLSNINMISTRLLDGFKVEMEDLRKYFEIKKCELKV